MVMTFIYDWLAKIGYTHPLHPVFVHFPIGLTAGAFFLMLGFLLLKQSSLQLSSRHVALLALLFLPFAIVTGIMDWQRFYAGVWLPEIKIKLTLAITLFLLLALVIWLGLRKTSANGILLALLTLAVVNIGALGYFGGELVYGSRVPKAPVALQAGQRIFEGNCAGCHPRGGNIIVPQLPLRSAPQLNEFGTFLAFLRNPKMPDRTTGLMPAFPASKLSDQEVRQLYLYLRFAFVESRREEMMPSPEMSLQ